MMIEAGLVKLGLKLTETVSRNSISWVTNRVEMAKNTKEVETQRIIYEEIINNLISDKSDLEFIARSYKDAYERVTISDDDIEHLQNTIRHVIDILYLEESEKIETFVKLINKDTLKTMQLLGFNYKEAIGQPLTELCANKISKFSDKNSKQTGSNKRKVN